MRRVFLAIGLPEPVRRALTVAQFLLPLPRRSDPADLHLTLVFLGEQSDTGLQALDDEITRLRAAPFSLTLQGFGLFGGDRPRLAFAAVLPSAPLMALQARLQRAAEVAGLSPEARNFHPHVTLGRFSRLPLPDVMRLERAVAEGAGFVAGPFPVAGFGLYESRPAATGPRYHLLADYPLTG